MDSALLQLPTLTDHCINSPTVPSMSAVPQVHSISTELRIHPTLPSASTVEVASVTPVSSQAVQNDNSPVNNSSSKFAVG